MIIMSSKKEVGDLCLYAILFGLTVFSNKYVLSVLNFIYPTIYQGWQTLVGGLLLKILMSWKFVALSTSLDKAGFISLLPSFLFFVAGIVASSKALAGLTVPIFLCLHNTWYAVVHLLERAPSIMFSISLPVVSCFLTIGSAITATLLHIDMTFADSPYFWMLVFIACLIVQSLHTKITDARYSQIDRLYYSYVFSVIVLAPASLYLEEAFEVMKFPNVSRYDFYAGCLLSGITGLFLNLHFTKVRFYQHFPLADGFAKGILCLIYAVNYSENSETWVVRCFIAINLFAASFIPVSQVTKDEERDSEITESLLDSEEIL